MSQAIDKRWYKVTLEFLKVIPMLLALCDLANTVIGLLGLKFEILSFVGGISILTLLFLYLVSYVFKFCIYHRMFLHYILVNNIINTPDYTVGLPISNFEFACLVSLVAGIFLFLILYFRKKEQCCKL